MQTLIHSTGFRSWIETSLKSGEHTLATSNQGTILLYQQDGLELVVKSAMGSPAAYRARLATLRREYRAYQRLAGRVGVPHCHGMPGERYLVIDYVRGTPYRQASFSDREVWFEALLEIVQGFHARGVSHGDLKSKSNILVTEDKKPCVIDFGTSFINRTGFHPINNYLFRYSARLDLNAWVKHKYHGRYEDVQGDDLQYLNYSKLEHLLRRWRRRGQ